jgi:hypothetical protein
MTIMKTTLLSAAILGLVLASPLAARAADTSEVLARIVADAQRLRTEAQDMRRLLDAKTPDHAAIQQRVSALESNADALKKSIAEFEAAGTALTPTQRVAFDRAKTATGVMGALLANKAAIIADASATARNRKMLRDQADTIAKRAEIVHEQINRVRG